MGAKYREELEELNKIVLLLMKVRIKTVGYELYILAI